MLCNKLAGNLAKVKAQYLQENRGKELSIRPFIFPHRSHCSNLTSMPSNTNQFRAEILFQNKAAFIGVPDILNSGEIKCHVISLDHVIEP